MIKHKVIVSGMTCQNCEQRVHDALTKVGGINNISVCYKESSAIFDCEEVPLEEIKNVLKQSGYGIQNGKKQILQAIGFLTIMLGAYMVLSRVFGSSVPKITESMSVGLIFVIGLFTSLHCVAMCGGIAITACATSENKKAIVPSTLYNLGRLTSYTLIGGFVGMLGSVVRFSYTAQSILLAIVGCMMIIAGINMLGIIPAFKKIQSFMPFKGLFAKIGSKTRGKSPYIVGLANGFMPCGPLQTMQLYALTTGSFMMGAISMFAFSLGTIPLMFGVGFVSSFAKGALRGKLSYISALLVITLGVGMLTNVVMGSGLIGNSKVEKAFAQTASKPAVQEIVTSLSGGMYQPITVTAGTPVRWTIKASKEDINFCNNAFNSKDLNIKVKLKPGDNVVEFTPTAAGTYQYQCWMNMIRSTITVLPNGTAQDTQTDQTDVVSDTLLPSKAVVSTLIPALNAKGIENSMPAIASLKEIKVGNTVSSVQEISTTLDGGIYKPIAVQQGVPVIWTINVDKYDLNFCNNSFYSDELGIDTKLKVGANVIEFVPTEEGLYYYQCWMNMIDSTIQVVSDITDTENIQQIDFNISDDFESVGGFDCCG